MQLLIAADVLVERFLSKIKVSTVNSYKDTPCWEFQGGRTFEGYGKFWVDSRDMFAHRFMYIAANGAIPGRLHVLHHCDNPPCCNPQHLWTGTDADNGRDRREKGRKLHVRNVPSKYATRHLQRKKIKLPDAEVPEVFRLRRQGMTIEEIGISFGVHSSRISRILKKQTRRNITLSMEL